MNILKDTLDNFGIFSCTSLSFKNSEDELKDKTEDSDEPNEEVQPLYMNGDKIIYEVETKLCTVINNSTELEE